MDHLLDLLNCSFLHSILNTLNMKLSKTLDQVSTLKEKDLKPFWMRKYQRSSFHHSKIVKEYITEKGWISLYTPPYSP